MSTVVGGDVTPRWLRLREPADAAARSRELVRSLGGALVPGGCTVVHDLGSGSGSMGRWLAPLLPGPQHWVLHDRDPELLRISSSDPPRSALDGAAVTVETSEGDVVGLLPQDVSGASLVTASALLDMLTAQELERLVRLCISADCPSLLTLSVTGDVHLAPYDPLDPVLGAAFNDHQRRETGARTLLGPDAVRAAVHLFGERGARVAVRPSTWRLDNEHRSLAEAWLAGWVGAACEQRPELTAVADDYHQRRRDELEQGRLTVTVGHRDLLARPRDAE